MISLTLKDNEVAYGSNEMFTVRRLQVDALIEPAEPTLPQLINYAEAAFVDTCAPYVVLPHKLHGQGNVKVHRDFGMKPYNVLSNTGKPFLQRFAEIGMQFLVKDQDGGLLFWPSTFVLVKAYLLEASVRPTHKVLIGLEPITENFLMQVAKGQSQSFLAPPG